MEAFWTEEATTLSVGDLAALNTLTRRGLAPSLPPSHRVRLALLPPDHPSRGHWEDRLRRHATACGCEAGSLAVLLVLLMLTAVLIFGGHTVTLLGLPGWLSWPAIGLLSALLVKASTLVLARHSLQRLYVEIAHAAGSARTPP